MSYEKLVDKRAYLNVIGCLLQEPTLIDDMDRPLDRSDFKTEDFYELLFVAIYNLYIQGCEKIDEFAIDSYLSNYQKQYKIFQDNHGLDYLVNAREIASLENYDYFYHRMRKFSLLRYYESKGLDTCRLIYNYNLVEEEAVESENQKFDKYSEQDIVDIVESDLVIQPKMEYCSELLTYSIQAGQGMLELVDKLLEVPDNGFPFTSGMFNAVCRGARRGKFYLRSASTGTGKAIPNDTYIPTPNGWRQVKDIRPGDYLFGKNGKPTRVLQIHPQPNQKEIWEVHFIDGRVAECCEDHLWEYKYQTHKGWDIRVESIKEIYERTNKLKGGIRNADGKGFRFQIPLNQSVKYPERKYSVDPYVMGALLGNGSFRYTDSNKALFISQDDPDVFVVEKVANILGYDYKKNSVHNYNYTFKPKNDPRHNIHVEDILIDYPELWQLKSDQKFIPKDYLLGSIEQRYQLLQGLMDTDGHIDPKKGRTSYYTMSEQLKDDVISLVRSLGMVATCTVDRRERYGNKVGYIISIQCKKQDKPNLFSLPRKKQRAIDYCNNNKREEHKEYLSIVDIVPTGRYTDMTCFTVDSDDHLFLMNDYIVTHNTRLFLMDACNFAVPYTYDCKKKEFVYTGHNAPTLYVGTEGSLQEFQTIVLAAVSGVNEDHILSGGYEEGEIERVRQAAQYISESPLYLVYCDDYSITDIENIAKRYTLTYHIDIFIFDYLQSSLKLMSEISGKTSVRMQEWQLLLIFSTRMKALAERLDIFILSGTQLSADAVDARYKDHTLLQGSKAIANKIDIGVIASIPNAAEQKKLERILRNKIGAPKINLLQWCYKVRQGKLSRIIICSEFDKGTMRIKDHFAVDFDFNPFDDLNPTNDQDMEKIIRENSVSINSIKDDLAQMKQQNESDETDEIEEVDDTVQELPVAPKPEKLIF